MIHYDKINRKADEAAADAAKLRVELESVKKDFRKVSEVLAGTMHEVRRFSAEISAMCEELNKNASRNNDNAIKDLSNTIFYTSGMLSSRLSLTDLELNPAGATKQATYRAGVYKKFEKASHVLAHRATREEVRFQFWGNSYAEIDALPSFELVPFIILDNAVKYLPRSGVANVSFHENELRKLIVTVSSVGPVVEDDELENIFKRNYRGRNAGEFDGAGLGLFLAKLICDYHGVEISARTQSQDTSATPPSGYGTFVVTLTIRLTN